MLTYLGYVFYLPFQITIEKHYDNCKCSFCWESVSFGGKMHYGLNKAVVIVWGISKYVIKLPFKIYIFREAK
jgi:hypothetical protein